LVLVFAIMAIRRRAVPTLGPNDDPGEVHAILLALAATLEEQSNAGTISERRYQERREEIKQALVDLRVRTREIGAISEYRDTEV
jgi:hypothetical protein